ncbi:C6 finger domain containing protein, partial [Colletotrichum tofieldiae]
ERGSFLANAPASTHVSYNYRPTCAQCGINKVACQWPEQRKRGPAKHYIRTMEKRLMETENVLHTLMTQVSDKQLFSAFCQVDQPDCQARDSAVAQSGIDVFELVKHRQFGPVYWSNYPLNSAQEIKRWWKDRASVVSNVEQKQQSQCIKAVLEENQAIHSSGDDSCEEDLNETGDMMVMDNIEAAGHVVMGRQTMSRASGEDAGQEATVSVTTNLGPASPCSTVVSNLDAGSAAAHIAPKPKEFESYENAFLW